MFSRKIVYGHSCSLVYFIGQMHNFRKLFGPSHRKYVLEPLMRFGVFDQLFTICCFLVVSLWKLCYNPWSVLMCFICYLEYVYFRKVVRVRTLSLSPSENVWDSFMRWVYFIDCLPSFVCKWVEGVIPKTIEILYAFWCIYQSYVYLCFRDNFEAAFVNPRHPRLATHWSHTPRFSMMSKYKKNISFKMLKRSWNTIM